MTIPVNLTLIREDFQKPRALSELKASMLAAPTDYVMVVGKDDIVDVIGVLEEDIHYLASHVATRRAYRHARSVVAYDPILLVQFNYMGLPIFHQSMVPLFPEAAAEPWHTTLVRAQTQGASFSLVAGTHTIIEPWPRPVLSGAYSQYGFSFDPEAVMEAIPTILVQDINHRPFYSLRNPVAEAFTAFCHNCSEEFMDSLIASNVSVRVLAAPDYDQVRGASTEYVAWFDGILEPTGDRTLSQLRVGLEFPGVGVMCPYLLSDFSPATYRRSAFSTAGGIISGFYANAWMARTRELGPTPPTGGYINTQAILREVL